MKFAFASLALACLVLAGCSKKMEKSPGETKVKAADTKAIDTKSADEKGVDTKSADEKGAANSQVIPIMPENTRINFVGKHTDDKPDRTGGFERFTGQAVLDASMKSVQSITVEIETASLWTEIGDRLTNHLNSPDFFDTREYPTAKFESTRIEPNDGSRPQTITGNLTLHGETKEISFPATIEVNGGRVTGKAEFTIDRTQWGMDRLTEGVKKEVDISVALGEKTERP